MLCDKILDNISDASSPPAVVDSVEFTWNEVSKRAFRKRTASGKELKILLPVGVTIRDGDVLARVDGEPPAVARVLPCEVIVVVPTSSTLMVQLALEIGNLHAPAEVTAAGELLILPDGPVEAVLTRMGLAYQLMTRRFTPQRFGPFVTTRL